MGKINKYANIYYKSGQVRKVQEVGKYGKKTLKPVSIEELETMIDEYTGEDKSVLDNMKWMLFDMYNKYGNPHEEDLIERIKAAAQRKTSEKEIKQALETLASSMDEGGATDATDGSESKNTVHDQASDGVHENGHRLDENNQELVETANNH